MEQTRRSLYFVVGYLYFGGAGFLLAPTVMLDILFAEGIYSHVTLRMMGALMLSLGMLVSGVIEKGAVAFYLKVLQAEIPVLVCLAYVYWDSLDRMWLIALVVTLAGWFYSFGAFVEERRRSAS
ncbi:MAG: hypothetical protein IT169_12400 [Bryobacterales bacterium]|nr:hypothetical protein [Bryobacterales bacterium]